jgi:hypothetical protein
VLVSGSLPRTSSVDGAGESRGSVVGVGAGEGAVGLVCAPVGDVEPVEEAEMPGAGETAGTAVAGGGAVATPHAVRMATAAIAITLAAVGFTAVAEQIRSADESRPAPFVD